MLYLELVGDKENKITFLYKRNRSDQEHGIIEVVSGVAKVIKVLPDEIGWLIPQALNIINRHVELKEFHSTTVVRY